jgi:hypothetical protein
MCWQKAITLYAEVISVIGWLSVISRLVERSRHHRIAVRKRHLHPGGMPEFMSILDLCSIDVLSGFVLQSRRDWFVFHSFDSSGAAFAQPKG